MIRIDKRLPRKTIWKIEWGGEKKKRDYVTRIVEWYVRGHKNGKNRRQLARLVIRR